MSAAKPAAVIGDKEERKIEEKSSSSALTSLSATAAADELPPELAALSQLSISGAATALSVSPTAPSSNWTLWRYECRDLPEHKCFKSPCHFCEQVKKLGGVSKGKTSESTDRWNSYLKRERTYEDEKTAAKALERFLPSKLAKDMFFDKKLGVALFRGDIEPKSENAENVNGVVFQMLLLATSGRKSAELVNRFDTIVLHAFRLMFDLPSSVGRHVNGIFLRCEINPGKNLEAEAQPYGNLMDLPFMAKLEVWTRDQANKQSVWAELVMGIQKKVDELRLPRNAHRAFFTINRMENWARNKVKPIIFTHYKSHQHEVLSNKLGTNKLKHKERPSGLQERDDGGQTFSAPRGTKGNGILVFGPNGEVRELDEQEENEWASPIFEYPSIDTTALIGKGKNRRQNGRKWHC